MVSFLRTLGLSAVVLPLALCFACSCDDSSSAQDGGTGDDAQWTVDEGVAESGTPVWSGDSTGFELASSGGFGPGAPDCPGSQPSALYRYQGASSVLSLHQCTASGTVDSAVTLAPAPASVFSNSLYTLAAQPATPGACGADAPEITLTILGPGTDRRSYDSDFYSGCSFVDASGRLFVAQSVLEGLLSELSGYIAACNPDAGAGDAGVTCVATTPDGGPTDGGSGG